MVGVRGVAEARSLVDLEAQVHVGDSLDVALGGSSGDLSIDIVTVE